MSVGWAVLAVVCSYGLGTIPGSAIVARRHGVDLRTTGDGNPGAWNALEQLGWRRAWPAFLLDGLKGLAAALLGWAAVWSVDAPGWLPWACVGAAMLGHAFPPWAPSRGGKAVMTFARGAIGLVPAAALPLAVVAGVLAALGRGRLGARLAVFGFPVLQAAFTPLVQVGWTGVLMTLIGLLFLLRRRDRV